MMIESTFCNLPGISLTDEKDYWRKGIRTWDDLLCWAAVFANDARYAALQTAIADSKAALATQRPGFFLKDLPESEWYRVYCDFPTQIHCLDIETDGLQENAKITCLSVLSAGKMCTFISGDNLELAREKLAEIRIAVTFNGSRFDIPRLMRHFPRFCPRFHLDLAKVLRKRKIRGSLKDLAVRFGWKHDGEGATITNGEDASRAWSEYQQSGDPSILESLRVYNQKDVQRLDFILRVLVRRHGRSSAS